MTPGKVARWWAHFSVPLFSHKTWFWSSGCLGNPGLQLLSSQPSEFCWFLCLLLAALCLAYKPKRQMPPGKWRMLNSLYWPPPFPRILDPSSPCCLGSSLLAPKEVFSKIYSRYPLFFQPFSAGVWVCYKLLTIARRGVSGISFVGMVYLRTWLFYSKFEAICFSVPTSHGDLNEIFVTLPSLNCVL